MDPIKTDGGEVETPVAPVPGEETTTVDYKAELEKAQVALKDKDNQLSKAEHKIVELKKESKEMPAVDVDEIVEKIRGEASKDLEKFKVEMVADSIDATISTLSSNADEQALIKFHYENSVQKTGFTKNAIKDDISNAYLIANKPRIEKNFQELKTASLSKKTVSGGSTTGQPDMTPDNKLSDAEEAWIKQAAMRTGKTVEEVRAKLMSNKTR